MTATEKHITLHTTDAPPAIGPYSQAKVAHNTLYIAGQLGMYPESENKPGQLVSGVALEQAEQVMKNIGAILSEAHFEWNEIVSTTVYITSFDDYADLNKAYEQAFAQHGVPKKELPARAVVQVAGLPKGGKVEMQAIAVKR